MLKCARATFFAAVLCFGFSVSAQTLPCPTGTLANVLGTSCSVGSIIFNFGPDFQAGLTSTFLTRQITPAEIGFIPLQSEHSVGFRLVLNFADVPPANGFSHHFVRFSYTPQAAPGSEIRAQSLSMDAQAQGGSPDGIGFVQAVDEQFYPNSGLLENLDQLDIEQGVSLLNQLSDSQILEVPGLLSTGSEISWIFHNSDLAPFQPKTLPLLLLLPHFCTLLVLFFLFPDWPLLAIRISTFRVLLPPSWSSITNSGRMVGSYQDFAGNFHGYVQETDGSFVTIDVPGAPNTFGEGLNERGDVVGGFTGPMVTRMVSYNTMESSVPLRSLVRASLHLSPLITRVKSLENINPPI